MILGALRCILIASSPGPFPAFHAEKQEAFQGATLNAGNRPGDEATF